MFDEMTRDFHHDEVRNGDLLLGVFHYEDGYTVFRLDLECATETLWLDRMVLVDNPELAALYDFDKKRWVEIELSCFWSGLQVCLG